MQAHMGRRGKALAHGRHLMCPSLLFSILERTPVVGRLTTVPVAAARFGVKALLTATSGSRFSQTAQTEVHSALQFVARDMLFSTGFELEQLCV